jgi:hypothetical protein
LQKARGATFGRSGREEACLSERVLKRLLNWHGQTHSVRVCSVHGTLWSKDITT